MKHTFLDLNKMGLTPMNFEEMQTTDGGRWWQWLVSAVCMVVGAVIAVGSGFTGTVIAVEILAYGFGVWAVIDDNLQAN